ncbi:MAG: transposase [Chloroflexi bacterium]|nr:transposase [Chloroflexota bacterium]
MRDVHNGTIPWGRRGVAAHCGSSALSSFQAFAGCGLPSIPGRNIRDEQRKFIKYNHLVANVLAFHNIVAMTKAIDRLKAQSQGVSDEVLAALSPYQTSHINRFGQYQRSNTGGFLSHCLSFASRRAARRWPFRPV